MRQLRLPTSTTDYEPLLLKGGLDLVTPLSQLKSGRCRDALNVEQSIDGGYARIGGYERFDGRPAPSSGFFLTLTVTITGTIAAGDTIVGVTSAATGYVLSVTSLGGGSFVVSHTKTTGTFVDGETLNVGGIGQGTVTDLGGSDNTMSFTAVQTALAADAYRADITAVPGSGPIRGGAKLNGVMYAWRNNAGGTALEIYKSSGSGWTLVPLMYELAFTTGTSEYAAGDTVTRGGASATVRGVALQSGTWAGGTAAGRLIIDGITGGPFTAGVAGGGGVATLSGAEAAITLLPGGRVQTDRGNFGTGTKLYGCDGVNRGFEFDGTTLVPIVTGQAVDTPDHVLFHKNHLWFAFDTNVQVSGITTPHDWTAGAGSVEFRFGDTVTGLVRLPGSQQSGAMGVMTRSSTDIIYGNSAADFNPVPFEESSGARAYGMQRIGGQVLAFGDTGVFSLSVSQAFGNFAPATLTLTIRPFVETRRNLCTGSTIHRTKSQYRVFFSDGYGLYITIANGKLVGMMPVLFPDAVTTSWLGESDDIAEQFFGSDNGMVYQLDRGTSFDGEPIDWFFELVFSPQGNRRVEKRYTGVELEMQGEGYAEFGVTAQLNYGGSDRPHVELPQVQVLDLTPSTWDDPVVEWDSTFFWDGRSLAPGEVEINGTGVNLALRFGGSSEIFAPFTISSGIVHYRARKARKAAR